MLTLLGQTHPCPRKGVGQANYSVPPITESTMPILWASPAEREPSADVRDSLSRLCGCRIETAGGAQEALEALEVGCFEAALGDFPIDGWEAEEWLEHVRRVNPSVPVIIREQQPRLGDAIRLVKLGAYQYLGAESPIEELAEVLQEAIIERRSRERIEEPEDEPWRRFLVGDSAPMKKLGQVIRLVAPRRCTVLVTGETGTGKEQVARALHAASGRSNRPMVALNCAALPEAQLEAELFGHFRGAFTGALNLRVGRFEQAHLSTLFLDEIGDLPPELQAKLLRVLQERCFQRLGSSDTISVDVRVIGASNSDLEERVRQGRFLRLPDGRLDFERTVERFELS